MSLTGLKDVDREILKHVTDKELLEICTLDRKTWNEVCDDAFLRRRLTSKYPGIEKFKKANQTWKQFFLNATYYISKMKDEFEFEYSYGDFKKYYDILKKTEEKGLNDLLTIASTDGYLPLVAHSVKRGADVHTGNDLSLRNSASRGHLEVVKYLVEHGANIHIFDDEPLLNAAENGHLDIVKFLMETDKTAQWDDIAFQWTASAGHLDVVKYMLEKGIDIHSGNNYALRWASRAGHLPVVKYLVEHGADVHARNDEALRWAKMNGHLEVVKYLKSLR